ncbi:MAG TPA: DUF502 domain-containing protein [Bdellovibrionota bacterium]|nr:DUF502 domain-containing protein [Bdellovibrionota bacterium]
MKFLRFIKKALRRYLLVGVIVTVPFVVTLKFLLFFIDYLDNLLAIEQGRFLWVIPVEFHPDFVFGFHVRGLGVVFTFVVILIVGILSRNYFGHLLIRWGDRIVGRIPLARVVYNVVKEFLETYVSMDKEHYARVVLVEFPRKGIYTIGLVTGVPIEEIKAHMGEKVLNVFVPTSPSPVNGFYLAVPEKELIDLDMTVEDAFKVIMSGGLVSPGNTKPSRATHGRRK